MQRNYSFFWRCNIQHNDILHNDTQHKGLVCDSINDNQHSNVLHFAQCRAGVNVIKLFTDVSYDFSK
jgi:hypothetical protein